MSGILSNGVFDDYLFATPSIDRIINCGLATIRYVSHGLP